ncbi:hypothetical protein EB73_16325 [Mycobacterium sp. SWH-M3]|nr:hypothetical protein EB73_16325 [Mycobacterium sp. SWH-M3]
MADDRFCEIAIFDVEVFIRRQIGVAPLLFALALPLSTTVAHTSHAAAHAACTGAGRRCAGWHSANARTRR